MDFRAWAREGYEAWERDRPEVLAFDTETSGVAFHDRPFCVTAAWRRPGGIECHYFELGPHDGADPFVARMLTETPTLVGHNIKFDLQKVLMEGLLRREHLRPEGIEDTELLAHLLDEHQEKGLKKLAPRYLDIVEETVGVEIKSGPNKGKVRAVPRETHELSLAKKVVKKELGLKTEGEIGYHLLPREVIVPYALKDAEYTLGLYELFRPRVERWDDLTALYEQERELTLVLLDMECAGFRVDIPYVESAVKDYGGRVLRKQHEIEDIVGKPIGRQKEAKTERRRKDGTLLREASPAEFNPSSPEQVQEWFAEQGIELSSTDAENLKKIDHPLARALLELRALTKMHGTYLKPILVEHRDGILHPNFRQNVSTGRMASGGAAA